MTEPPSESDLPEDPIETLRTRLEQLEHYTQESRRQSDQKVILAELKIEATRAHMIDLDGLQFLDMNQVSFSEDGSPNNAAELIGRLKHVKPWLFATPSSSSVAKVPISSPPRQKLAKDMSDAEYRVARAHIIKRSVF